MGPSSCGQDTWGTGDGGRGLRRSDRRENKGKVRIAPLPFLNSHWGLGKAGVRQEVGARGCDFGQRYDLCCCPYLMAARFMHATMGVKGKQVCGVRLGHAGTLVCGCGSLERKKRARS